MAEQEPSEDAPPEASEPSAERVEEEQSDDAHQKASDPDLANRWWTRNIAMDVAMQALVGGGTANVFMGDASVGHLGDRDRGASSGHLGVVVRSGPVSRAVLDRIRESYVEPSRYQETKRRLEELRLVLIRTRRGSGRTTTALRLLDQLCRAGVRKLDPDVNVKTLREDDLEDNHGYLLDSPEAEQARALRSYQAERIGALLESKGCRLVVILDESTPLDLVDLVHHVVDDLGSVTPAEVLRRHLADVDDALFEHDEVRGVVEQFTDDTPCGEVAELAGLLREVADGTVAVEQLAERCSRAGEANFVEWFDRQTDTDLLAFVIAPAVFNDESVQLVSAAAEMLADRIRQVELPRRADRAREVFKVPLEQRVREARAKLVPDTQELTFGKVPVLRVRFEDNSFPYRVLRHVCAQYDQANRLVRDWLLDLGSIPGEQVRIRAGMAAGLLSLQDFPAVYELIVRPWAVSGDENERWAAVAALRIPGSQSELDHVVYRMLKGWISHGNSLELRTTAARALGSTEAMSPAACLRLLRYAARHADWDIALAIGESVTELFCRVDDPGQVLAALVRWSDDDEHPKRRETAVLALVTMAFRVTVRLDESVEPWPALIWQAEHVPAQRRQVVLLFSRLLQMARFMGRGYHVLREWTRRANKEPALREPLARLLLDIGAESDELDSIRYYLEAWGDERDGPAKAVRAVLRYFDERGE
ncbi:hypothetical protein [Saccharothrix xinjiangensis]|uniref:HEAT repeat protein n=1 Tax=Saccharothrix xinjiangensis TaxID=204798 RepID=A0ABV9XX31_9PSEU